MSEERVRCSRCPIKYSCPAPKEDRWRDFLDATAREEDCPLVRICAKEAKGLK